MGQNRFDCSYDRMVIQHPLDSIWPARRLQVQVAIECLGEQLIWGYQGVEGSGLEGNRGVTIEVPIKTD